MVCNHDPPPDPVKQTDCNSVTNPWKLLKKTNEESLQWLLEKHSTSEPYERGKAGDILRDVESYGKSLVDQLQLADFVGVMLLVCSCLIVSIHRPVADALSTF